MSTAAIHVPDLLRRHASAPYSTSAVIHNIQMSVHTNDASLLTALQYVTTPGKGLGSGESMELRVIRDSEAPSDGEDITILSAWPLTTLLMGSGTVLFMDGERREILGFLASAVTAAQFVHELLPMLLEYVHCGTTSIPPTMRTDRP